MDARASATDVVALVARLHAAWRRDAAPPEAFAALVRELLRATGSGYGAIAEAAPRGLRVYAPPGAGAPDAADGFELEDRDTLVGAAFGGAEPLIVNDAARAPRGSGLPPGHPSLAALLAVPLSHGGVPVGVMALANRPGGYDDTLVHAFAPAWAAAGAIVGSLQLERERRRAAAVLDERDTLLSRLTAHLPAVIFQYRRSPSGWESMPSATAGLRELYGLEPHEVRDTSKPLYHKVFPDDRPRMSVSVGESARTLSPWRLEFRVEAADGSLRWHEGHALPERESDGGTLWYGYIIDISERKRYQEALVTVEAAQHANAAKTEFLSRMSHELRTPLNAVLGFAQLLQLDDGQQLSELQRARVAHIEHAGAHLLAMINDVLDLSRIEAGTMPLAPEPLPVQPLLDEALALVGSQANGVGVRLMPAVAPPGVHVAADRVRLRQVLVNLLSNAIKYNRAGGMVQLRAERSGREVSISVTDSGIGLTPEQLAHLWEPFNRLGAERTSVEGTGIGLALCQRMVQMMDGRIDAQSRAGHGTTFTVQLPAANEPTLPDRLPAARLPAARRSDVRRTVLYAEDNPLNVELVQQVFQLRPQFRLLIARSGDEALKLARSSEPDLLLLDIHLGDMSGLELRSRLSAEGIAPPAVALSADVAPQRVQQALDAGFIDYLVKPLDIAALVRCVDRVLAP